MTPQKEALSEALRELAAESPQASPELGARLTSEFARHHQRRRLRNRVAIAVGLASCLAISVALFRTGKQTAPVKVVEPASQTAKTPSPEPKTAASESPEIPSPSIAKVAAKPRIRSRPTMETGNRRPEPPVAASTAGDFVALPTFDPSIPLGVSRMVRVDMPGSALQLIGYPVDGQLLDRRIVADVLVGQDGMPYAVRLVQTANVH